MNSTRDELVQELFERHYHSIYQRCLFYVDFNPQFIPLVEDCLQDAYERAIICYDDYKEYSNPAGWIATTAMNRLKSEMRKYRYREKLTQHNEEQDYEDMSADNTPEIVLDRDEINQRLLSIYAKLTDKEKSVFVHYFVHGKKLEEVAHDAKLSSNSVRSAVRRIRQRAKGIKNFIVFFCLECFFQFWRTK